MYILGLSESDILNDNGPVQIELDLLFTLDEWKHLKR